MPFSSLNTDKNLVRQGVRGNAAKVHPFDQTPAPMPLLHHCGAGEPSHPLGFVIGCGGAGCNALHSLPHLSRFEPVAVNDMPSTAMAGIPKPLLLGKWKLRGLAEIDDSMMRELRSDEEKKLAGFLGNPDLVFIVAGLGREMGSWAPGATAVGPGRPGAV